MSSSSTSDRNKSFLSQACLHGNVWLSEGSGKNFFRITAFQGLSLPLSFPNTAVPQSLALFLSPSAKRSSL